MKLKNVLSAAAAAGLVLAPLAAQAGTAAASIPGSASAAMGSRSSGSVARDDNLNAGLTIAVVVAAGAAAFGLSKAIDKNDKSKGAS